MRPNDGVSRPLSHLLLPLLLLVVLSPCPQMAVLFQPEVDVDRIYIAGLFPLTSPNGGENAAGVLPSVKLALEHVNRDRNLLPHHILDLDFNDTQVRLSFCLCVCPLACLSLSLSVSLLVFVFVCRCLCQGRSVYVFLCFSQLST